MIGCWPNLTHWPDEPTHLDLILMLTVLSWSNLACFVIPSCQTYFVRFTFTDMYYLNVSRSGNVTL